MGAGRNCVHRLGQHQQNNKRCLADRQQNERFMQLVLRKSREGRAEDLRSAKVNNMQETIESNITVNTKPGYAEWLRSLKLKAQQSAQEEQEELQWRQRYGKT